MQTFRLTAKKIVARLIVASAISFPWLAQAQDRFGINYGTGAGLGTRDVRSTIAALINTALSILGVVFLVIAVVGGARWMMAAGSEEQVESGKKAISQAVIGLLIVFVAFAVTRFVFEVLERST